MSSEDKFIIKLEFDSRNSSCSIPWVSTGVIQLSNCTNTNTFQRVNGDTADAADVCVVMQPKPWCCC